MRAAMEIHQTTLARAAAVLLLQEETPHQIQAAQAAQEQRLAYQGRQSHMQVAAAAERSRLTRWERAVRAAAEMARIVQEQEIRVRQIEVAAAAVQALQLALAERVVVAARAW